MSSFTVISLLEITNILDALLEWISESSGNSTLLLIPLLFFKLISLLEGTEIFSTITLDALSERTESFNLLANITFIIL